MTSNPTRDKRAAEMVAMYREGLTLEKVGRCYGITRERVRQIIRARGVTRADGGASRQIANRVKRRESARAMQSIRRWGFPPDVMTAYRSEGLTRAYASQRNQARMRGIAWNFDFATWIAVWQTSGKLHLRGRGKGHYVMSRVGDAGPYELGNVHIQLAERNSRDATKKWIGKHKAHRGVFLLYPGRKNAWLAMVKKVRIGFFATEAEAAEARARYMREHGLREFPGGLGSGRGWTYIAKNKSKPYRMQITGRKNQCFATAEEAHAAYVRITREMLLSAPELARGTSEPLAQEA